MTATASRIDQPGVPADEALATGLTAQDVMTRHVVTIDDRATVGEALSLMRRGGVRHLPVTVDGVFVGMVDDRLVTTALLNDVGRCAALEAPVDDVLMRYVPQVFAHESLSRVANLLRHSRCDAVVVVDADDRLIGLITMVDLVSAVAHGIA